MIIISQNNRLIYLNSSDIDVLQRNICSTKSTSHKSLILTLTFLILAAIGSCVFKSFEWRYMYEYAVKIK